MDLVSQAGVIGEQICASIVAHGLRRDGRPHGQRVPPRKLLRVLVYEISELEHGLGSVGRILLAPGALEGLLGGIHGGVDVLFACRMDLIGHESAIGGIVYRQYFA